MWVFFTLKRSEGGDRGICRILKARWVPNQKQQKDFKKLFGFLSILGELCLHTFQWNLLGCHFQRVWYHKQSFIRWYDLLQTSKKSSHLPREVKTAFYLQIVFISHSCFCFSHYFFFLFCCCLGSWIQNSLAFDYFFSVWYLSKELYNLLEKKKHLKKTTIWPKSIHLLLPLPCLLFVCFFA